MLTQYYDYNLIFLFLVYSFKHMAILLKKVDINLDITFILLLILIFMKRHLFKIIFVVLCILV